MVEYEATRLKGRHFVVRPRGQLGTCGFYPIPWQAVFTKAATEREALKRARNIRQKAAKAARRNPGKAA
jgi:hypothetical protein